MTTIFTFQQFGQLLFLCIHTAGFCKEKNNTSTRKHKEMSESTKSGYEDGRAALCACPALNKTDPGDDAAFSIVSFWQCCEIYSSTCNKTVNHKEMEQLRNNLPLLSEFRCCCCYVQLQFYLHQRRSVEMVLFFLNPESVQSCCGIWYFLLTRSWSRLVRCYVLFLRLRVYYCFRIFYSPLSCCGASDSWLWIDLSLDVGPAKETRGHGVPWQLCCFQTVAKMQTHLHISSVCSALVSSHCF